MTLSSMTGFAVYNGEIEGISWSWELKSVNGKTLELRTRLPNNFEALEPQLRLLLNQSVRRGTLHITLNVNGGVVAQTLVVNEAALEQLIPVVTRLRERLIGAPVNVESLLALPGIIKFGDASLSPERLTILSADMMAGFEQALTSLLTMRYQEGARLSVLITEQLDRIEQLVHQIRDHEARKPENIKRRLTHQLTQLTEVDNRLDDDRLYQEAIMLATRADVQEEIDRLLGHIEAARSLMSKDEPVGRKFDFLAQEFNREANTLCAKAIDRRMINDGLEIKTIIDQMREQVQNIE